MRQQGEWECEANTTCKCKRFVLDHVDTISGLRGERDRLRARTHEIAEAKDQQYREAMRDHARLKVAVDQARERTREWKADWAFPRNPDAPYQWWSHTSHNHAMEAVALVVARNELRDALAELVRLKDLKVNDPGQYETEDAAKEAAWVIARELLDG
jgi:hypothetical protein